jgi:hypothetical protein
MHSRRTRANAGPTGTPEGTPGVQFPAQSGIVGTSVSDIPSYIQMIAEFWNKFHGDGGSHRSSADVGAQDFSPGKF